MQKTLFVASLLIFAAFALTAEYNELSSLWSAWKSIHTKSYGVGEDKARFAIFSDNYRKILKFNAENASPKLGLNKFADLTAEEFKNKYSRCAFVEDNEDILRANTLKFGQNSAKDVPTTVDWRGKGVITPIKNQGQCGSCWSFSTTGTLEGFYAINNKKLLSFSEQQIVDCDTSDYGCGGGWPYLAITYAGQNGLEQESEYPYTAQDGTCNFVQSKATKTNTGYSFVTTKSVDALKAAVATMPVSVAIEADQDVFQLYTSGVISGASCGASIDHAVLVVGYDSSQGSEAWIVKNSWGEAWGDAGYVYISTLASPNGGLGVCGILYQPVVPT